MRAGMANTNLPSELAYGIAELIRTRGWKKGKRLPERLLAEEMRVSRSPIRAALKSLEQSGVVSFSPGEGYVIEAESLQVDEMAKAPDEEATYLAIASDRVAGRLGDRVSESELMRRYGLSRSAVSKMLSRIASEGWIERLPGNGWEFLPMLQSDEAYLHSFRYRIINEPAAILEPTFVLNETSLRSCREQQVGLISGDLKYASALDLFEINNRLHESIVECSNNSFVIDSIRKINRLRRLMELGVREERRASVDACHEHVQILDLLLEGRRQDASDMMRLHLSLVSRKKAESAPP
jgi:DNA-binding GntR family transcriptional regulator